MLLQLFLKKVFNAARILCWLSLRATELTGVEMEKTSRFVFVTVLFLVLLLQLKWVGKSLHQQNPCTYKYSIVTVVEGIRRITVLEIHIGGFHESTDSVI